MISGIDRCLDFARSRLSTSVRQVQGQSGWYHKLGDLTRLGHVATSQGALLSVQLGQSIPNVSPVICDRFLDKGDFGGWAYLTGVADTPLVDSTAWCLLAMSKINPGRLQGFRDHVLVFFERASTTDRGMGAYVGDTMSRTYHSAMALRALLLFVQPTDPKVQQLVDWFNTSSQTSNGRRSWGRSVNQVPTIAHTAHVVSSLLGVKNVPQQKLVNRMVSEGAAWLADALKDERNRPTGDIVEEVEIARGGGVVPIRVPLKHSAHAWAVAALAQSGGHRRTTTRAAELLVEHFHKCGGKWLDSNLHEETMWSLYDHTTALKAVEDELEKEGFGDYIRRRWILTTVFVSLGLGGVVIAHKSSQELWNMLLLPLIVEILGGVGAGKLLDRFKR